MYSWQSMFLAVVVAVTTQSLKRLLERVIKHRTGGDGEAKRKASVINVALFPLVPLVLGGLLGRFFPIRPEYLVRYVTENHTTTLVYLMWGVSVGQLSDYLYQRTKRFLLPGLVEEEVNVPKHTKTRKSRNRRTRKPAKSPPATVSQESDNASPVE